MSYIEAQVPISRSQYISDDLFSAEDTLKVQWIFTSENGRIQMFAESIARNFCDADVSLL